jgi:hypothetical protein
MYTFTTLAKTTALLEVFLIITDTTYFGLEKKRLLFDLIWGIMWVAVINITAERIGFLGWIIVIGIFIYRMFRMINEKKKKDESKKDESK